MTITYDDAALTYDESFVTYDGNGLYVGAPFSGSITGMDLYCGCDPEECPELDPDCCDHPSTYSFPTDVDGPDNITITFYGPTQCQSVVVTHHTGCFCNSSAADKHKNAVKVQMYDAPDGGGNYIGLVYYLHVEDRISAGTYNENELDLGTVPGGSECCFSGSHSHVETSGQRHESLTCSFTVAAGDPMFEYGS